MGLSARVEDGGIFLTVMAPNPTLPGHPTWVPINLQKHIGDLNAWWARLSPPSSFAAQCKVETTQYPHAGDVTRGLIVEAAGTWAETEEMLTKAYLAIANSWLSELQIYQAQFQGAAVKYFELFELTATVSFAYDAIKLSMRGHFEAFSLAAPLSGSQPCQAPQGPKDVTPNEASEGSADTPKIVWREFL